MTTLIITVDDERIEALQEILREIAYVRDIDVKSSDVVINEPTLLDRIKAILNASKGKGLFQDIKDPVEWQRNIRGHFN